MAIRYAGQKLRASYVVGTAADEHLLASDVPASAGAVAGKAPVCNQFT